MKISKLLILISPFLALNPSFYETKYYEVPVIKKEFKLNDLKKENTNNIILISNKGDLLDFISKSSSDSYSKNKIFNLTKDIDLEGETIKPIPIFAGKFNGNNHLIKNFKIDSTSSGNETGFIRLLTEEGEVNNLIIDSEMVVKSDDTNVGGLVGTNKGLISNCTFKGKISARHFVGGIVGENDITGKIEESLNEGLVSGKIFTAGIAGFNKGEITKCTNKGVINDHRFSSTDELTLSNVGGIVGFNQNKIDDCTNYGQVGRKQVGSLVGGISGSSVGIITNSINYGEIRGDINIGGIVGHYAEFNNDEKNPGLTEIIDLITNLLDKESKNNKENIKLGPSNSSSLNYCYNNGFITGNSNVGGIAGYSSSASIDRKVFDINNCINEGPIEANKEGLGGIAGNQINGKIYECFNVGNIQGKNANYVGGIAGESGGEIAYCFSINDMIGNMYVGGIGGNNRKIHDCYSISKIDSKNAFVGAISGYISEINSNIYDNYYVNDDFYGIDNIDYENKSTKVSKNDLASKGNLNVKLDSNYFVSDKSTKTYPQLKSFLKIDSSITNKELLTSKMIKATEFVSFVNFIDENGNIIKKISVKYGEDLDLKEIPNVPQKEGYFAKWSDFDNKNIISNLYIKPIYDEIITTIASEKGPHPVVLVDGKFYKSTYITLKVTNSNILNDKSIYTYLNTYNIEVKDDYNLIDKKKIKIKIQLPSNYENIHVATLKNDKLNILDSKIDGNYIVFDATENQVYHLIDQKFANWNNGAFVATVVSSIIGGILITGGTIFLVIYLRKKKKQIK